MEEFSKLSSDYNISFDSNQFKIPEIKKRKFFTLEKSPDVKCWQKVLYYKGDSVQQFAAENLGACLTFLVDLKIVIFIKSNKNIK